MSYSMEEKVFHLQRMWAEGLTPGRAAALYGCPSRGTLRGWVRDWEEGRIECARPAVPGSCEHRKHKEFPEATRREALRLLAAGKPAREVAAMLGLPGGATASRWAKEERRAKMPPPGAKGAPRGEGARVGRADDLEARVAELEEQNAVLRELMRDPKAGDPAGTRRGGSAS